jgi:hypothetical protein
VQQNAKIKYLDDSIRASLQNIGSTKTSIDNTIKSKETLEQLRNEYIAYDYFMRCMHTNGISYDIIKKKLPIINDEIAKTLSNIVDFEVFFENESNKLNVLLKHTNGEPRPIEMGSGAENGFGIWPNFGTYSLMCIWDKEENALEYFQNNAYYKKYQSKSIETLTVFAKAAERNIFRIAMDTSRFGSGTNAFFNLSSGDQPKRSIASLFSLNVIL